jgi:hypothetical protein
MVDFQPHLSLGFIPIQRNVPINLPHVLGHFRDGFGRSRGQARNENGNSKAKEE